MTQEGRSRSAEFVRFRAERVADMGMCSRRHRRTPDAIASRHETPGFGRGKVRARARVTAAGTAAAGAGARSQGRRAQRPGAATKESFGVIPDDTAFAAEGGGAMTTTTGRKKMLNIPLEF